MTTFSIAFQPTGGKLRRKFFAVCKTNLAFALYKHLYNLELYKRLSTKAAFI